MKIKVAVDAPLLEPLSYLQNDQFSVKKGDWVTVPLGKRQVLGLVLGLDSAEDHSPESIKEIKYKSIIEKNNDWPSLSEKSVNFINWLSEYYIYPPGQVAALSLPPLKKSLKKRASKRPAVIPHLEKKEKPQLTAEQKICLDNIDLNNGFSTHLIHGVTGSGKTEIYLRLFEDCLNQNKKGFFLVPEISLTPQLTNRFVERFGEKVAVLHSQLTDRERTDQWWEAVENNKQIIIGARSALFCPVGDLGLIVVDEEHESSFKQDEKLKYHGRDAAIMLGKFNNCTVILGSATPSLETWKNQLDGRYKLHTLKNRVADRPLPQIHLTDMRLEKENDKRRLNTPFWMSENLRLKIEQTLEQNQQVALLLNRRGVANLVFCRSCGYSAECPNCDVSLILHGKSHLVCHYCDYHDDYTLKCPDCSEGELAPMGIGTEKVEEDLKQLFPHLTIARADRDEIQSRVEMESLVKRMEDKDIHILVGTQMIAKGLDFPHLNLVGLVLADVGFNLPDFRATEKSFQLVMQMSGRSGRHSQTGQVVIQTYNTEHESLTYAVQHDYNGFVSNELLSREPLKYPPFQKLIAFRLQSMDQESVRQASYLIRQRALTLIEKYPQHYAGVDVLGPAQAPLAKLNNQHRMHLLLKGDKAAVLNKLTRQLLGDEKWVPTKVKITVDVDPVNML